MKRIEDVLSVEAVKAAYQKTGLQPETDDWGDLDRCACAAAAVICAQGVHSKQRLEEALNDSDVDQMNVVADLLGVPRSSVAYFTSGFDDEPDPPPMQGPARDAWEHGRSVRAAVFDGETGASS